MYQNAQEIGFQLADQSDDGGSAISRWAWDFGDGTTSGQQNPAHVYGEPGAFSVSLTVTNPGGSDTASRFRHIMVDDEHKHTFMLPGDVPLTMVRITFSMGAPGRSRSAGRGLVQLHGRGRAIRSAFRFPQFLGARQPPP